MRRDACQRVLECLFRFKNVLFRNNQDLFLGLQTSYLPNDMNSSMYLVAATIGVVMLSTAGCSDFTSRKNTRPNLIILFSDDAGYADFGFHGSLYFQTPHLGWLADSRVRLSQLYVSAYNLLVAEEDWAWSRGKFKV